MIASALIFLSVSSVTYVSGQDHTKSMLKALPLLHKSFTLTTYLTLTVDIMNAEGQNL